MGVKKEIEQLLKPLAPEVPKVEIPKPVEPKVRVPGWKGKRTLGNIWAALEAQRVYTGAPSVPKPQAPPANLQGQGSAPALGTEGAWGKPE